MFQKKIRVALNYLFKSKKLNVGPYGTHIGILTFNARRQPIVLLELGQRQTQKEIINHLDHLKYGNVSGDLSRTRSALQKIVQVFRSGYNMDLCIFSANLRENLLISF